MYCLNFQPPQKEFTLGSRDTKTFKTLAVSPKSRWALTAFIEVTRLHYTQTRFFSPTFPGFFQVFASFSIFGVLLFLVFIHPDNSTSWKQKKGGEGERKGRRRNPTQFFFKKKVQPRQFVPNTVRGGWGEGEGGKKIKSLSIKCHTFK